MVAEALAEALERREGIEVLGLAGTAAEARDAAGREEPDVVLMDYMLPDEDGVRTTARIKEDRPQTKVVMLTSQDDDSVLSAAIEAGCSGFLPKDSPIEEVVSAVRAAHVGESVISPALLGRLLKRLHRNPRPAGHTLTPREVEVLSLLAEGASNPVIAERLFISPHTVRNHVQNVITKMGAHSKLEAVAAAVRGGIVDAPR